MSKDPELWQKLLDDDDEIEDVELHKEGESPVVVKGIAIDTSTYSKKKNSFRRGFGCCCKCIGITMVLFILLGLGVMAYAYSVLDEVVEEFTIETDSPKKFPIVFKSDAELEKIVDRVDNFVDDILDEVVYIEDLVLTQDEINAFAGHSDFLRGNLMVTLHKDRIVEEYSIPMEILGYSDRYFVGTDYVAFKTYGDKDIVEMKMETEATHEDWFDGPLYFLQLQYLVTKNKEDEGRKMLELYLQKGSFFGQSISEQVIEQHVNLLRDLYDDSDHDDQVDVMLDVISGIESVSVEEGKVIVKARHN